MYERICAFDNLYAAYLAARKGKRAHPDVAAFEFNAEAELIGLRDELLSRTYAPGRYRSFTIHEPKRRLISAAPFRDRVAHHALCRVIAPLFERRFIGDSYANRVGKGTHRALDRCTQFLRRFKHVMPLDVVQFFPSIDHAILRNILARAIPDLDTVALVDAILRSGAGVLSDAYDMVWFPGDSLWSALRPRGLPIGNLTSQFWANVYLNEFDQFAKRALGVKGYLRYVDDILIFGDDKSRLRDWHAEAVAFLSTLRLTVHDRQPQPRPVTEGIPFLGFTLFPEHRRLKRRRAIYAWRRLKAKRDQAQAGALPLDAFEASLRAWIAHAQHGDTWGLRRASLRRLVMRPMQSSRDDPTT
jgi:retron-type reverse transcriptase